MQGRYTNASPKPAGGAASDNRVQAMFKLTLQVGKDFKLSVSVPLISMVTAILLLLSIWA